MSECKYCLPDELCDCELLMPESGEFVKGPPLSRFGSITYSDDPKPQADSFDEGPFIRSRYLSDSDMHDAMSAYIDRLKAEIERLDEVNKQLTQECLRLHHFKVLDK